MYYVHAGTTFNIFLVFLSSFRWWVSLGLKVSDNTMTPGLHFKSASQGNHHASCMHPEQLLYDYIWAWHTPATRCQVKLICCRAHTFVFKTLSMALFLGLRCSSLSGDRVPNWWNLFERRVKMP